jgi:hypothetical protein
MEANTVDLDTYRCGHGTGKNTVLWRSRANGTTRYSYRRGFLEVTFYKRQALAGLESHLNDASGLDAT